MIVQKDFKKKKLVYPKFIDKSHNFNATRSPIQSSGHNRFRKKKQTETRQ